MRIVSKLLAVKNDRSSTFGAVGLFIGILMFLSAFQLYQDVQNIGGDESDNEAYLVVNKEIGLLNTLSIGDTDFNQQVIDQLKSENGIEDVAGFKANLYRVSASSTQIPFRLELYFESVPTEFIDVDTSDFKWKEGQQEIPIIISSNIYNMFNFGFTPSQNLPKISKELLRKFEGNLKLSANGKQLNFTGRVVGLSDRINSILVPANFLDWSNAYFAGEQDESFTRLILKVEDINSPEIKQVLRKYNLQTNEEMFLGRSFGKIVDILFGVVTFVGGIIFFLALIIVVLSMKLSLHNNRDSLVKMRMLGISYRDILRPIVKRFAKLLLIQLFGILMLFLLGHHFWVEFLKSNQIYILSPVWTTTLVLVVILGVILFSTKAYLSNYLKKLV